MPVARLGVVDCLCTESIDFFQVTVHQWGGKSHRGFTDFLMDGFCVSIF